MSQSPTPGAAFPRSGASASLPVQTAADHKRMAWVFWAMASLVLWLGGGLLTGIGLGPWYDELTFPSLQPPGWVFTPMWMLILSLLAVATVRITTGDRSNAGSRTVAVGLYGFQFGLNLGWSVLFFAVQRPDAAMAEILILDVVVAAMVVAYAKIDRVAGLMLVPYLVWLLFATAINIAIVQLNGPFGINF
ncbi:MAG: TspO/MBR family protein [Planctomycetota bacterium]